VYRFSLAWCRAVCLVALVIILVEDILVVLVFGHGWVVFLARINFVTLFFFGKRYFIICR
jgi:hypothetical protein